MRLAAFSLRNPEHSVDADYEFLHKDVSLIAVILLDTDLCFLHYLIYFMLSHTSLRPLMALTLYSRAKIAKMS